MDPWLASVITALGLVLGVLIAYMQVQKNQKAAIRLQEAHLRNELKVKLYERVAAVLSEAGDCLSRASTQYYSILSMLDMRVRKGFPVSPTVAADALSEHAHSAQRSVSRVLTTLEEYEILFMRFAGFRRQIAADHSRLLATHSELWSSLLPFMPFVHSGTKQLVAPQVFPTAEQLNQTEDHHRKYLQVCGDISGFLIDLQIETQNELLGELFDRQLPPRHPADPTVLVLRRDESELIERPKGSLI